jgi:F-type H+-transporting ATPase subunit a
MKKKKEKRVLSPEELAAKAAKQQKRKKTLIKFGIYVGIWAAFGTLFTLVFGSGERETFGVHIFPPEVALGRTTVSECTLYALGITAVVLVLSLIFRFVCVPRFKDKPGKLQNVFELAVENLEKYTTTTAGHDYGTGLPAYMMTLAIFLISSAFLELFGIRSPSADILMTLSMAIITFVLINYFGIKKRGLAGRITSYFKPSPVVGPFRMISDMAVPISLACRLFGNMLAGLIIIELLYYALGNFSAGPIALLGLYFNLFHPLIQGFIFITLTLSFIGEATETAEE